MTPATSTIEHAIERSVGQALVQTVRTPVQDVVSFRGSFRSQPDLGAGEGLVQDLTVALLDKGTRRRDRFAIADVLERRGAQLQFSSNNLRVSFHGRVLRRDLSALLDVLEEQLREPLLDEAELAKARERERAKAQQRMERTGPQAAAALTRMLFPSNHPNYDPDPEADYERLQTIGPEDVRRYHESHFGARDLVLTFVGDLDHAEVERLSEALGAWAAPSAEPSFAQDPRGTTAEEVRIPVPGKPNVDVRLGHALALRRQDPAYAALYAANYVLGGNFSARLMTAVRGEQGLTYGIGSALSGISTRYAGYWRIAVTLSHPNLEEGVLATRREIDRFVREGISAEELAEKQSTIAGSFYVGLATTGGLALGLHTNAVRGFPLERFERFPREVEALTLDEVNAAIRKHFKPEQLSVAQAGEP